MKKYLSASVLFLLTAWVLPAQTGVATADPQLLTFNATVGSTTPLTQNVTISSNPPGSAFGAAVSTATGGNWLSLDANAGFTPQVIKAQVNPTGLAIGTYTGQILFTVGGANQVTAQVVLNVTASANLTVNPTSATFNYQPGTPLPNPQTITLVSGLSGNFTTAVSITSPAGGNWLLVTPSTGAYPGSLQLSVNPVNLPVGSYDAVVTVTPTGTGSAAVTIPVRLNVSNTPIVTAAPNSFVFNFQTGGAAPVSQLLTLSNLGQGLPFTATATTPGGVNWLTLTPTSGTTPGGVILTANPANLQPGTYQGTVSVAIPGAGNTPINVPVTFHVSATPLLSLNPASLTFNAQTNAAAPQNQTVSLTSTGAAISYTASASTASGGAWLSVTPQTGSTPGQLVVSVNQTGLQPGTYSGVVSVVPAGQSGNPQTIPVTLVVSANPVLVPTPTQINLSYQLGSPTQTQTQQLLVGSSGTNFPFAVGFTTQNGGNWLTVTPTTGTTGTEVTVTANAAGLAAGTYLGFVSITSAASGTTPQVVPVVLTVNAAAALTVTPESLTFSQVIGAAAPAAQQIAVGTNNGLAVPFTAQIVLQSGSGWLSVTPTSGTTPANLSVSAAAGSLAAGTYNGYVLISSTNLDSRIVPVTFTVATAPTLALSSNTVNFTYTQGALNPQPQTVKVTSTGSPANFTITSTTQSGGNWLFVSPVTGTTPADLAITISPTGLNAGNYTGTITVTAPGATNSPQTITVNLTVTQVTPVTANAIVNSASQLPSAASPGELITIYGTNLGPATPVDIKVTNGQVDTALGNVRVLFDNIPAPLTYVSATQINAIVPYEVAGRFSTSVVVSNNGTSSAPIVLSVVSAAPAIFTAGSVGTGQGAILNQNFSANSAANPADRGSIIAIYGTGEGQTDPPSVTGRVQSGSVLPQFKNITARVGGVPATVLYSGAAPGLVAGVFQVNVQIPASVAPGSNVPVELTIGGVTTRSGVTVAVR